MRGTKQTVDSRTSEHRALSLRLSLPDVQNLKWGDGVLFYIVRPIPSVPGRKEELKQVSGGRGGAAAPGSRVQETSITALGRPEHHVFGENASPLAQAVRKREGGPPGGQKAGKGLPCVEGTWSSSIIWTLFQGRCRVLGLWEFLSGLRTVFLQKASGCWWKCNCVTRGQRHSQGSVDVRW